MNSIADIDRVSEYLMSRHVLIALLHAVDSDSRILRVTPSILIT